LYPLSIISKSKGFRIASLNVNSLLKHIDEIPVILEKNPLDVLYINESKIDDLISCASLGDINI
jgi:exonuclease III